MDKFISFAFIDMFRVNSDVLFISLIFQDKKKSQLNEVCTQWRIFSA